MDLLANYDDETGENSSTASPKVTQVEGKAPDNLENEWLSFEEMISAGGMMGSNTQVKKNDFLVNGVVAYPGMKIETEESVGKEIKAESALDKPSDLADEDDDAFLKLRKQVRERDHSSSSSGSRSSGSSSRSSSEGRGSPSPPRLSPVRSEKSHTSEPPDLTGVPSTEVTEGSKEEKKVEERRKSHHRSRSRSHDRKRSHRSKHHHRSSKSKKHRSHSRDRHRHRRRHKEHRSSKDDRSHSRERKDSHRSDTGKDDDKDDKGKSDGHKRHRSRSRDRKDRKKRSSRSRHRSKDRKRSRSKDRKRSRSKDRKRSQSKDRKRSRSKDRKRSRSKDRKRSRSKDRKRSRSRDKKRKHRSRSREKRSRSRDRRSRSRSFERLRSRSPVMGRKLTFKEQMRKQFINASKEMAKVEKVEEKVTVPVRRPGEPLKPSDLLKGVQLNTGEAVTPQMALMQTMAAMHKKAQELTGVEVPKYYNPAAVNPLKYAEQIKKRKLLWSKKPEEKDKNEQIETQWKSAFISEDDGKTACKFRKLMGMKDKEDREVHELPEDMQKLSEEQRKKQQELFQRLDQEYEFARMTTHTQRGVGLGFSTTVIDPNHPNQPT